MPETKKVWSKVVLLLRLLDIWQDYELISDIFILFEINKIKISNFKVSWQVLYTDAWTLY